MFKDSVLYNILGIIPNEFSKGFYYFILKLPALIIFLIVGVVIALICDFFCAFGEIAK